MADSESGRCSFSAVVLCDFDKNQERFHGIDRKYFDKLNFRRLSAPDCVSLQR